MKLTNNTHAAPYDAGSTQTVAFSHYNNITMQLPLDPGTAVPSWATWPRRPRSASRT